MKQHFIDNRFVPGSSGDSIDVIDPSTGVVFEQLARGNAADIDLAVQAARRAYEGPWGALSAAERGRLLLALSRLILDHHDELTQLESRDCGKPLKQARADVTAVARYFEFYGGAADKLLGETIPYQHGYTVLTLREPHGVTGHIVPWNYPLQIFGRSIGGALAAGNACVVKPAEDACLSLLRVAELAAEAGLPPGALNIVTGYGHEAGDALARHPGIDHISFTGSPRVGVLVSQTAAENHVPVTLELGGKSPQIVFADADLDALVPVAVNAIVQNAGQTCSAGSRILIERSLYDRAMQRLAEAFARLRTGPAPQDLDCGPLIRKTQLERVQGFLREAQADGIATAACGSIAPGAPADGFYQAPTLLDNVPVHHRLAQEEIFGPVLAAIPFDDEADALRIANSTQYGLAASIWTRDGARQLRLARKVRSGQVFINNYGAGGGVELPFGGVKASGHGREKGFEALYGFTVLKTIAIKHD
ncbi:aldehyde dehydrogenase [Bordetella trematum]|uniref:Aldehyde dehydrogenase n=1 Tax=Bordetella trematum TaxID=123899 RepID=A0A157MQX7_9BORD|nr:aldehyde dehydrogenase family protein [Bordetella trematum]AUL48924.1 aldehyde dehydrogenase [Bordetella trematum]AZR95866.1 aldehyde dehydrogenase [Bordetella trematum]NNH21057.1 aldehyde dehydrogenase family protein [Bordetella trematum]QIM70846.1 aldehyde dehydrogenase family protein [Bordetella trematum]CZZ87371.1 aldehyde dehydrogenase [Bordetella trematum]